MYKYLLNFIFFGTKLERKNVFYLNNYSNLKISNEMKEIIKLSTMRFINMKIKEEQLRIENEKVKSYFQ